MRGMFMSEYILDDIIEEFFDEDSIEQDIHHHPVSWCLALFSILPPLVMVLLEIKDPVNGDELASLGPLQSIIGTIMELMATYQFAIAPVLCFGLAYRRHMAPAVLVAMGSSAILLASETYVDVIANEMLSVALAVIAIAPFVIVLRNKRTQLNPGRSRQIWATLMATSILMFAVGTLVPAVSKIPEYESYAWASIGLVVIAIGWAWPRGRHIVEEIADDIVEAAT
jgi:hypothetical protein